MAVPLFCTLISPFVSRHLRALARSVSASFLQLYKVVMRKRRVKPDQYETHYHNVSRTVHKRFLMNQKVKDELVLPTLKAYAEIFYLTLHSFALLDNHYHIVLTQYRPDFDEQDLEKRFMALQALKKRPEKWADWKAKRFYDRLTDISEYMKTVNWRISYTYNRSPSLNGRAEHEPPLYGHFWADRPLSIIIEDQRGLEHVCGYVEQNAVKAGLAVVPSEYPWCSAGQIEKQQNKPIDIDPEDFLCWKKVEAPDIGRFRKLEAGPKRDRAYVAYMDCLSLVVYPKENYQYTPPKELLELSITDEIWQELGREIKSGKPANWSSIGYGSEEFEKKMAKQAICIPHRGPP